MKKWISMLLTLGMIVGLTSCGRTGSSKDGDPNTVEVGVAIYKFDDNFMTLYREELQRYFEEDLSQDGVRYHVTLVDGKGDQAEQTNQIDNFIANQVDVLICNLVQASSASTVVEKCRAANIPVVFINREPAQEDLELWPGRTAYVGADARQSGTFQGEIIADTPNQGDWNGNGTVDYVMIMGDPENVDAQYRTEYSVKALEDAGLTPRKLFEQRGDWDQAKGQELAQNALTQFGDQVDVIFCNNDAMALGAAQAISAADRTVGRDIYLVGVDALEECQKMVQAGTMTGTVLNDHVSQAHTAAEVAIRAVNGEDLEPYYWVDYVKVVQP